MSSIPDNSSSLSIEYSFADCNSARLAAVLARLEREIGGKRAPYWKRGGAIDLVTYLELTLTWVVGITLSQLFKKYAEGLLDADSFKKMGESHRVELRNWYSTVENQINSIIDSVERIRSITPIFTFQDHEECLALVFGLPNGARCYIALNHCRMSSTMLKRIPQAVVNTLRYAIEDGLPEDVRVAQLYYDQGTDSWPYLFIPTLDGFGNFVDRYVDLESRHVHTLLSADEFLLKFCPDEGERLQLIISPLHHNAS